MASYKDRIGISATIKQTRDSFEETPANERLIAPLIFLKSFIDWAIYQGVRNQQGEAINRRGEGVVTLVQDEFSDSFLDEGDCKDMKVFQAMIYLEEKKPEIGQTSFKSKNTHSNFWIDSSWGLIQEEEETSNMDIRTYMKAKGCITNADVALQSIKFAKEHYHSAARERCFLKID